MIKIVSTLMYTLWHVDKYKITSKLFINYWARCLKIPDHS